MVENVGHYIVDAGGKRLRPLLALLCGAALGECTERHIKFAATIEFIHTATLLHDDVVDISSLRRGRPTANAEFGNAPSVLVGDFLYTRAFQLMVQLADMDILSHMADTTNAIAEGEVLQLVRAGDAGGNRGTVPRRHHPQNRHPVCGRLPGRGHPFRSGDICYTRQNLHQLRTPPGYRLPDDRRRAGLRGRSRQAMGKNVGDDLTEGKVTLPLIHVTAHRQR